MNIKEINTNRGFKIVEFNDMYNTTCNIQESSLIHEESCFWIGIKEAKPRIMARDATKYGISLPIDQEYFNGVPTGWVEYLIPSEVFIGTRMHLTKTQCKELIVVLNDFIER